MAGTWITDHGSLETCTEIIDRDDKTGKQKFKTKFVSLIKLSKEKKISNWFAGVSKFIDGRRVQGLLA